MEQLLHRHDCYNQSIFKLKKLEADGKVVLIRPSEPINIKRMEKDPKNLQTVYELGRKDGLNALNTVKTYTQN